MPPRSVTVDPRAQGLLDRANSEPAQVINQAPSVLEVLDDPDSVAVAYRAMSVAARNAATIEESIEFARRAAETAEDTTLRLEAIGTLSGSLAISGDTNGALDVLSEASAEASGLIAGQLLFQRAFVLTMTGDYERALGAYEEAMPLFREHDRTDFVAMALHNQGYIYTRTGRLADAEAALVEARGIEAAEGRHMEVAGTDHNLGLLASYQGDIPEALRRLTMSDETHMRQTGDDVPRHVSRCEVLLSAGMYREALDLAKRIAVGAREKGRAEDEADALLVAARAAFLNGDPKQAIGLARTAAQRFERHNRDIWVTHANLALVEARYEAEGASVELGEATRRVAAALEGAGFVVPAARARILAGRIAIDLGNIESAAVELSTLADSRSGPVELRLQKWQGGALLRLARGDARGADAAARAGLDLLDEYQAGLGASDLRSGIERQGADLGEIGLRLAADSGTPRRVFRWMERTRARALRHRPVVPGDDDPEQRLLAELRRVSAELRKPENREDRDLLRRRNRLQEELRGSNRARRGVAGQSRFSVDDLLGSLEDRTLVELGSVDGRLLAVVIRDGRFRLHEIGDAGEVEKELNRLRFDLRRAARMRRDPGRVREAVGRFDTMVLGGLRIDAGEVVLVPSAPLMAAPWAVLPSLLGSTLTVSPSAEIWWGARARQARGDGVVLAAGPDLANAGAEIDALKSVYGRATVLGPGDTTEAFGSAVRGAAVAHAACHASFEVDNPMFSSLRLGDGDFNVYDMERVHHPPDLMVLSACDSGYTETRAGDELAGVTSALLSMGSKSVVASVGLVPDSEATSDLMLRFHRGLQNATPAQALSHAQSESLNTPDGYIAAASFLCIGGG